MTEFILVPGSKGGAEWFNGLDDFTQGYVEAMFFTETGCMEDGELEHATVSELAMSTRGSIVADCRDWQAKNAALLKIAYGRNYTARQAGHDYWFCRNGHSTGFWARRELDMDGIGNALCDAAKHGEICLIRGDDEQLYLDRV